MYWRTPYWSRPDAAKIAMKAPNANAYEYSPVEAGPRSREMKVKSTRLEKSAANRQTDNQKAFLITIMSANTNPRTRSCARHTRLGLPPGANVPVCRIRGQKLIGTRKELEQQAARQRARAASTAMQSAANRSFRLEERPRPDTRCRS